MNDKTIENKRPWNICPGCGWDCKSGTHHPSHCVYSPSHGYYDYTIRQITHTGKKSVCPVCNGTGYTYTKEE